MRRSRCTERGDRSGQRPEERFEVGELRVCEIAVRKLNGLAAFQANAVGPLRNDCHPFPGQGRQFELVVAFEIQHLSARADNLFERPTDRREFSLKVGMRSQTEVKDVALTPRAAFGNQLFDGETAEKSPSAKTQQKAKNKQ